MLRKGITTFYVNYQVVRAIRTSFVVPKVSNRNWFLNPRTTPSVRFTAKGCQNPEPPNWFKIPNHPTGSGIPAGFGSYRNHTIGSFGGMAKRTDFGSDRNQKFLQCRLSLAASLLYRTNYVRLIMTITAI